MDNIEILKKMLAEARRIAVITGAGISTPSGIKDIRSKDGAANDKNLIKKYKYDYETIVSHSFFMYHTEEFFRYYKEVMVNKSARPNKAHYFLKDLEKDKDITIITQNIDGLHTVAGSSKVIEFHGSIERNTCMSCSKKYTLQEIMAKEGVPHCSCGGIIKPDVVLFEESLNYEDITRAVSAIERADMLLIIGSSLVVYPAAGLPGYFRGNNIAIINKDPTPLDGYAKVVLHENIIDVINALNM